MLSQKKSFAVLLWAAILSTFATLSHGGEVIRIATVDYPPYVSPTLNQHGVLVRIVTEAFRLEGVEVELSFFPDLRAYKYVEVGEYDATMPWAKREERLALFHYGEPLIESDREVFFFRKGLEFNWNPKKQDYEDIRELTVGAIQGSNYGAKFMNAEREGIVKVIRVNETVQNFQMLRHGRIDLMISPERVALYTLKTKIGRESKKDIRLTLAIDEPVEYDYLLISKKSKKGAFFLEAMNRRLKKLKKSGRYKELIEAFDEEFELPAPPEEVRQN